MNQDKRILYVEDDETLSFVTKDNLELKGYMVDYCADGEEALKEFKNTQYDICVLDIMLPKMDGITLAKKIRETNKQIPIIFLTAKSTSEDKIAGLKTGADDYITKPFTIEELILKIEVFLRRRSIVHDNTETIMKIGYYTFDFSNLLLTIGDDERKLTFKEAEILRYFWNNRQKVIKREDILEDLWGKNDYFIGRSLDVFISRLRKYLKKDPGLKIINIHGIGFKFELTV